MNIPLKLYLQLLDAMVHQPGKLTQHFNGRYLKVRVAVKVASINESAEINPSKFPYWELTEDNGNVWLRYWTGVGEYKDIPTPNILPGGILHENKVYVLTEKEIKS